MPPSVRFLGDEITPLKLVLMVGVAVAVGVPLGVQVGETVVQEGSQAEAIEETDPPTIPIPEAPEDGAVGVSRTPTFSWLASQDASRVTYTLSYSPSPNFNSETYQVTVFGMRETEHTVTDENQLPPGVTIYWRVFAVDRWSNPSGWSDIQRFTTGP
jgi:hypothetical protein